MTKIINASVIGATGYAGAEIVRLLCNHPNINIKSLTSRRYSEISYSDVYPSMKGVCDIVCEDFDPKVQAEISDIIFLALPHKLSMKVVKQLYQYNKKIIDLSADFRFKSIEKYESVYEKHIAPDLLEGSVYGLCEIFYEKIKKSALIGNPGCYPTSVLLPLIPLINEKLIDAEAIIIDSKSGVTGAGRELSLTTHFCEVNEGLKAYKIAEHRHAPEIEEYLSYASGKPVTITFTPHLVPMNRGILSTIYADLTDSGRAGTIRDCLLSFYENKKFVRICSENHLPNTKYVTGTNYCDIGFRICARKGRLIIISAIDNLVKGAAGQAIQNMNIMMDIPEETGLLTCPFPV